jgi:hypothetical protein
MASETEGTFTSDDEKDAEILYWQHRALEAERMLVLEKEYIEDLYELRDAGI